MPAWLADLEENQRKLLEDWGVQDFHEELRTLPAERLLELFHHPSKGRLDLWKLMYNLVWQAYTQIKAGTRGPVEGNIRTFWYTDVKSAVSRLGLLQKEPPEPPKSSLPAGNFRTDLRGFPFDGDGEEPDFEFRADLEEGQVRQSSAFYVYNTMINVFYSYVSSQIFKFREFGFTDDYARFRILGTSRPDILFFAEKTGFSALTKEMNEVHGCTAICLGGEPKLLSSEYFMEELSKVIDPASREFWLLACVDYDPFGSIIARQFQQQLSFFGLKKSSMTSLITQDILTPEEQELYKYQLPINSKTMQTIVEKWVKETGGVNGEPYGIESDVVPRDRIRARVAAAIQSETPSVRVK